MRNLYDSPPHPPPAIPPPPSNPPTYGTVHGSPPNYEHHPPPYGRANAPPPPDVHHPLSYGAGGAPPPHNVRYSPSYRGGGAPSPINPPSYGEGGAPTPGYYLVPPSNDDVTKLTPPGGHHSHRTTFIAIGVSLGGVFLLAFLVVGHSYLAKRRAQKSLVPRHVSCLEEGQQPPPPTYVGQTSAYVAENAESKQIEVGDSDNSDTRRRSRRPKVKRRSSSNSEAHLPKDQQ